MSTVYTVRFGAEYLTSGSATFFTATPGYTWILRDLVVAVGTPEGTYLVVYVGGFVDGPLYLIRAAPPTPLTVIYRELRQELLVGEHLIIDTDAGSASVMATGYRFYGEQYRPGQLPSLP